MAIDTNERSQLVVVIPRIQYAIRAVLLATTAALCAVWMIKEPSGSPETPRWVHTCAFLCRSVFAAGLGWLSLFARPPIFDAQRRI